MIGIGVGIGRSGSMASGSLAQTLANSFQQRVLADGGTYEADACLVAYLNTLINVDLYDSASLLVTPNGVKSGKIYSVKPTDASGDFTFTRASVATRVNSVGVVEVVPTGVPSIDYSFGACPMIISGVQRTNLFLNSAVFVTQNVTTAAVVYTVSFYGTGTITFSGTFVGSLVGTGANNRVSLTFTATAGTLTSTLTGSATNAQLEAGSFASSCIITTGATATRVGSMITQTRTIATNTMFINAALQAGSLSDGAVYGILDIRTASNNRISIYRSNNTIQLDIINTANLFSGSIFTMPSPTQGQIYKFAIKITPTTISVFINGVARYTNNSISIPTLTAATFTLGAFSFGGQWGSGILPTGEYPTALSDANCTTLTT